MHYGNFRIWQRLQPLIILGNSRARNEIYSKAFVRLNMLSPAGISRMAFSLSIPEHLVAAHSSTFWTTCVLTTGVLGGFCTYKICSLSASYMNEKGICGVDRLKKDKRKVPFGGILACFIYMSMLHYYMLIIWHRYGKLNPEGSLEVIKLLLCIGGISLVMICGLIDDYLSFRWRYKIMSLAVSVIPSSLLYSLAFNNKETKALTTLGIDYIGETFYVKPILLRYICVGMLSMFCVNSFNLVSGVNGVEISQILVIIAFMFIKQVRDSGFESLGDISKSSYSLIGFLFFGVSLGLVLLNWYPAKVFPGNVYSYTSGMVITLMIILTGNLDNFFIYVVPQMLNFLYMFPQLLRFVPCPRHAMPRLKSGSEELVESSKFTYKNDDVTHTGTLWINFLDKFSSVEVERDRKGNLKICNNMTILNLILIKFGPMKEKNLTIIFITIQFILILTLCYLQDYLLKITI